MTHTKDEALLKALEDIKNNAGNPEKVYQISSAAIQQALATPVQEPVAWMPIETAPQDGTKILGWNEKFGARETQMTFYGEGSPGFAAWKSRKGPKESGWNWSEPKSNWSHTWKPTHWMPMPAAPVLEAAIGYSEGYQEGWNAAMDSTPPAAPVQECFWRREGYKECPAAQRQWVGLTVLEQADCFANTEDATEFYHAIEAKLKEKNSD
jgi:hypothetical protein